jgi:hypothetical protein
MAGEVEVSLGPCAVRGKGHAYTSLFLDSAIAEFP